jgi:hypothetical protein
MTRPLLKILAAIALLLSANTVAYAQATAHITVYGTHHGGNIVYHYKVINNGDVALHNFIIGSNFDNKLGYEIPQLERLPLGWSYGREGETGTAIILAPSGTGQPTNWGSKVYGQEEIDYYYLEWKTTAEDHSYGIPPGQSLSGFNVTIPLVDNGLTPPDYYNAAQTGSQQDDIYLTGNFKVQTWDAQKNDIQNYWGKLEIEDTTAPALTVTLTPNLLHQNGRHIPITATITVKDNYDPQPEINLVSITCNEPMDKDDIKTGKLFTDIRQFQLRADHDGKSHAGRIYTVTYIAIDGSGNQTEASATVTVPHDRKEHEEHRDDKNKKSDKDDHKRDR